MHTPQLARAAHAAALATDTALGRLAAPEDHPDAQIAGALVALERVDDTKALCALVWTSAELAAVLARRDHARTIEALCDLHAAASTVAAHGRRPAPRTANGRAARR